MTRQFSQTTTKLLRLFSSNGYRLVKIDQIATESCSRVIAVAHSYGSFAKMFSGGGQYLRKSPVALSRSVP